MAARSFFKASLFLSILSLGLLLLYMRNGATIIQVFQGVPLTAGNSNIKTEDQIFIRKAIILPNRASIQNKYQMYSTSTPEMMDLATATPNDDSIKNKSINDRFRKRREHLLQACKKKSVYQVRPSLRSIKDRNLLYDSKHNFVYCMVEKIGSTFWRRIFYLLNHPDYLGNLYSIDHYYVHAQKLPTLRDYDVKNSTKILASGKTAMFVRDPYERAFSGYVDKLFSINVYYMQHFGRGVIKLLRKNATNVSLKCGHDLTFEEFLEYLVQMKEKRKQFNVDVHFSQIYTHCLPCEVKYDFIGKMETFDEDTEFLIKNIGEFRKESLEINRNISVISSIRLVLNDTFNQQKKMAFCMTKDETYYRAWRTLQLRGLVNPNVSAPSNENATVDMFVQRAVEASDPTRVSEFKRKAVVDMYKSVPSNLLNKFRDYVLPDCKLFGYNDRPIDIFG